MDSTETTTSAATEAAAAPIDSRAAAMAALVTTTDLGEPTDAPAEAIDAATPPPAAEQALPAAPKPPAPDTRTPEERSASIAATKARRAAVERERAALARMSEAEAKLAEANALLEAYQRDPIAFVDAAAKKAGRTFKDDYEAMTKRLLNGGEAPVDEAIAPLAKQIAELRAERERERAQMVEEQKRIATERDTLELARHAVTKVDEFPLLAAYPAEKVGRYALQKVHEHYADTGEVLDMDGALRQVHDELVAEHARLDKFAAARHKAPSSQPAPKAAPPQSGSPAQTLKARDTAETSRSVIDMTDEERKRAAERALRDFPE